MPFSTGFNHAILYISFIFLLYLSQPLTTTIITRRSLYLIERWVRNLYFFLSYFSICFLFICVFFMAR